MANPACATDATTAGQMASASVINVIESGTQEAARQVRASRPRNRQQHRLHRRRLCQRRQHRWLHLHRQNLRRRRHKPRRLHRHRRASHNWTRKEPKASNAIGSAAQRVIRRARAISRNLRQHRPRLKLRLHSPKLYQHSQHLLRSQNLCLFRRQRRQRKLRPPHQCRRRAMTREQKASVSVLESKAKKPTREAKAIRLQNLR